MRRERGNIILTALFVAVFLFFLSIALIWTNRQDIALSLAMEHKMKGEAAARTGAMTVYASMRNFGQPPSVLEGEMDSGASWRVEILELPQEGDRGTLFLLQSRGTSGPLSSYYTMHLLENSLGKDEGSGSGRMLGFITRGVSGSGSDEQKDDTIVPTSDRAEDAEPPAEAPPAAMGRNLSSSAKVLYGDFELKDINLNTDPTAENFAANAGPLFFSSTIEKPLSPLAVYAYIPVFSPIGGAVRAYGPVIISAPPSRTENALSALTYENEEFQWEPIPFPVDSSPQNMDPPPVGLLQMEAPLTDTWTTVAARAIADAGGSSNVWKDLQPATSSDSEAQDLTGSPFEVDSSHIVDWSTSAPNRRGYVLRGTVASWEKNVYSHSWEYMYKHYSGTPPGIPIPNTAGNTVTRWPCIRKYSLESKQWSTAWSSLKDSGDVRSEIVPDPSLLLVTSDENFYGRTATPPYRLVKLESGGQASLGEELPAGKLFLYKNKPYTISTDLAKPGLRNVEDREVIGFDSLPKRIPEISGPVVVEMPDEVMGMGTAELEVTPVTSDGPETPQIRTIRHEYNLKYAIDPSSGVAVDGDNLYACLQITMTKEEPTYDTFGTHEIKGPPQSVLARYDGERWHILPQGLMAALDGGLAAPSGELFCARYPGLPEAKSRFTVVSIDVDPFEFSR